MAFKQSLLMLTTLLTIFKELHLSPQLKPRDTMQVGDIVRTRLMNDYEHRKDLIGVIVGIRAGTWPKDWEVADQQKMWEMSLGRRVDVMWAGGGIIENFPEQMIEVVKEHDNESR